MGILWLPILNRMILGRDFDNHFPLINSAVLIGPKTACHSGPLFVMAPPCH